MALVSHQRITFSATGIPSSSGPVTVASYDLSTGGPGLSNIDNVTIIAYCRFIAHSANCRGHRSMYGLFRRTSGTLIGPISGSHDDIPAEADDLSRFPSSLFTISGNSIQVSVNNPPANTSTNIAGSLEFWMQA